MGGMQVKTRANSSAQGKQRVFFSAHPEDHALYFDVLTNDILTHQNCAVYHAASERVHEDDLQEMQLFVFPVTARFLNSDCDARCRVLPFALAHHIPVLPIMAEGALSAAFNRICGDLQYLDPHEDDPTALPYEEKLARFLDSVLIGDETAERIRSEFYAYIFLSYRKKDREHAQRLMRLIHQNDFCRDIAIWYDEYLTPGENFNESIAAALQKSRLFVLAVTPNIVNEDNYIMTTEYPMARDMGKPILPVELVETKAHLLEEKYERIPEKVAAKDESAFSKALFESLDLSPLKAGTAEHKFFIGLAYLGGVDVETDYTRALSLITNAAEAGLPSAIQKLVEMYRTGLACARSYETAILWQKRLTAVLKKNYEKAPSDQGLDDLFWATVSCGDYFTELSRFTEAKDFYKEAVDAVKGKMGKGGSLTIAFNRLGTASRKEGLLDEAKAYHEKALSLDHSLAIAEETPRALRRLAISHINLGDIFKEHGEFSKALPHYEAAMKYHTWLLERLGAPHAKEELAISCNRLGDVFYALSRHSDAKMYYAKALELNSMLAEETKTPASQRGVASCYQRNGAVAEAEKCFQDALIYYEKARNINRLLVEQTDTIDAKKNLAISHDQLGDVYKAMGNHHDAVEHYSQALDIRRPLAEQTDTTEATYDLMITYNKMGAIAAEIGHTADARSYYEQALSIAAVLTEKTTAVHVEKQFCAVLINLGDVLKKEKKFSGAKVHYEKALALLLSHMDKDETVTTEKELAVTYTKLGDVERALGNSLTAKGHYEKAARIFPSLLEKTDEISFRKLYYFVLTDLSVMAEHDGRASDARSYYEKMIDVTLTTAKMEGTTDARWDLVTACYLLADLSKREKKYAEAAARYAHAIQAAPPITKDTAHYDLDILAVAHYNSGLFATDREVKRAYWKRAVDIYEILSLKYPEAEKYKSNATAIAKALAELPS